MQLSMVGARHGRRLTVGRGCTLLAATLLLGARVASAAASADLKIRATSTSFTVGANGVYTLSITNLGPAATDANVHVLDTLPDGISFLSGSGPAGWTCTVSGRTVDCQTPAPLLPATTTSFRLVVGVCTAAFPFFTNTLTLAYEGDPNTANNSTIRATNVKAGVCNAPTGSATPTTGIGTAVPTRTPTITRTPTSTRTVAPAATDLLLTKTVGSSMVTGSPGTYVLTVSNIGAQTTNDTLTIVDTLPRGMNFAAASGVGWSCTALDKVVTCTNPTALAPLASTALLLTVNVSRPAFPTVTNEATLFYSGDTNTANNSVRRPTTVRLGSGVPPPASATATNVPGAPTATRTPTATPTRTPSPPINPAAPVVTSFTCNGASSCELSIGQSFSLTFSWTDTNGNASGWHITATRDDGVVSDIGRGNILRGPTSGTVPLTLGGFTCNGNCRRTHFDFTVVVSDSSGKSSAPATVGIDLKSSSGQ